MFNGSVPITSVLIDFLEKFSFTTSVNNYYNSLSIIITIRKAIIELARKAQYFYYVKFRLGACLPAKCSSDDVQRLAQVGKISTILLKRVGKRATCLDDLSYPKYFVSLVLVDY